MSQETELFTDAELELMQDELEGETETPAEIEETVAIDEEPVEAVQEPAEEVIEEDAATAIEEAPLPSSGRYQEVAMTETVPPEYQSRLDALAAKFDESEIDINEYLKERALVDRAVTTFQINEAAEQKFYNSWMDAQDNFLNDNRQYANNAILFGALDTAVKEVQADPRSRGLTPAQVIAAADFLVKDSFGLKPEARQEPRQEVKPVKPGNLPPNIPTLNTIPASAPNDTGVDPFSAVDRLTGDAKEAAIAKLSPEQYEAYLRS